MEKPKIRFKGYQEDWEQRKLIDLVDVLDGDRGKNYPTSDDFDISGHTLFLNASNVTNDGFLFQDNQFITEEKSNSMGNGKLEEDDIVVTSRGSLGHIAWYNADISSFVPYARINSGMLILRNKKEIETEYLYHFMKSSKGQSQISFISFGSAQPQLTKKGVEDLEVILPTRRDEQVQLGHYFSNLDNLITLHQRKCEETKILKKYMLQKMFPQNGHSVPEIRFSGCTEDWEQRKLGDAVEFLDTMRKPLEGAKRIPGPYPYYGASGIVDYVDGYLFDEELILLSEDGANITDRNYPVCFLASGKYWVNNHAHVLRTKQENENNFICNSLERKDYTQYNTGMAMPKLNKETCKKIPISCPGFEEQKKIGDYFRSLDHLITLHQQKCDELRNIKKFMLQNMFI
ncbi:EcoKI restriction-modification system protein HsdS [uncultured Blautia sp.]|nr:restriction endonuclease subunit S [Hoministercoradaptatus ammoniilyticus]SCJ77122.1 EcoKI restriction-modification system protein HsdS [uncultured Blautia sp.]